MDLLRQVTPSVCPPKALSLSFPHLYKCKQQQQFSPYAASLTPWATASSSCSVVAFRRVIFNWYRYWESLEEVVSSKDRFNFRCP